MSLKLTLMLFYHLFLFCQGFYGSRPPNSSPCRRYPWNIDTSQDMIVGYKVVAPTSFDIGLCSDSCQFPATEGPLHRQVLDRFRVVNPAKVPIYWEYNQCGCKSYQPISMIVDINGKYEKQTFNTLVCETCECS